LHYLFEFASPVGDMTLFLCFATTHDTLDLLRSLRGRVAAYAKARSADPVNPAAVRSPSTSRLIAPSSLSVNCDDAETLSREDTPLPLLKIKPEMYVLNMWSTDSLSPSRCSDITISVEPPSSLEQTYTGV